MKKTLRVKAVAGALIPDYPALRVGLKRFIGWKFNPVLGDGEEFKGGWELVEDKICEVPNMAEYRKEIKLGNLVPADAQTAKLCGLRFKE
jgi:hypothetical protein